MSRENILNRMRQKQTRFGIHETPLSSEALIAKSVPTVTILTHQCGHIGSYDFHHLKPAYLKTKVAKETTRNCPLCRQAKNLKQMAKEQEKAALKANQGPRMPSGTGLGCTFNLTYVCAGHWEGSLTGPFGEDFGGCAAKSMRECIAGLNHRYWKSREE